MTAGNDGRRVAFGMPPQGVQLGFDIRHRLRVPGVDSALAVVDWMVEHGAGREEKEQIAGATPCRRGPGDAARPTPGENTRGGMSGREEAGVRGV